MSKWDNAKQYASDPAANITQRQDAAEKSLLKLVAVADPSVHVAGLGTQVMADECARRGWLVLGREQQDGTAVYYVTPEGRFAVAGMTAAEWVVTSRDALGLSQLQLAELLGYYGTQNRQQVDDLETGRRPLREPQRRLIEAYLAGYRPKDWPL